MSETEREYAANYRQPPLHTPFQEGPVRQSARSAGEKPGRIAALNETVTVTENG
jgi:hypothetical protein